uniref:Uncharacterized protein n=1 Tax=Lotus japonicus TaxID=34305 RepID=I3SVL3_LOTJA|nr:unknown [Lotus japonicus]
MGLLHFSSQRQTRNSTKLRHPWLVPLKPGASNEPIKVAHSKNSSQSRKAKMRRDFRNPSHTLNTSPSIMKIERTQMGLSTFLRD